MVCKYGLGVVEACAMPCLLATSPAIVVKIKGRPNTTYGRSEGAPPTLQRVDRCGMNHTRRCDKHGKKKLESRYLHL